MKLQAWISLAALGFATSALGQFNAIQDGLPGEKSAYMLLPAEEASRSDVTSYEWSSDGNYLLIKRRLIDLSTREYERLFGGLDSDQVQGKSQIAIYSAVTGKTKVVTDLAEGVDVEELTWINGTDTALIQTRVVDGTVAHRAISMYAARTDRISTLIAELPLDSTLSTHWPTPYASVSHATSSRPPSTEIQFIGENGLVAGLATVPEVGGVLVHRGEGNNMYFITRSKGKAVPGGWQVVPSTGAVSHIDVLPPRPKLPDMLDEVALEDGRQNVIDSKPFTYAAILKLRCAKSGESIVVTTDGVKGQISPGATAVSYESRGSLMVRRIVKVPLDYFKNQLRLALRKRALENAKQVGLGLLMCAADYDNVLPGNGNGWQDKIGPYLRNNDLSGQFNYTYAGGPMTGITNPAQTELGYINGPDGKAIVYADGHAQYIGP